MSDKVFVAGHNGLVGASLLRALRRLGRIDIITKSRKELDLRDQRAVHDFFSNERPDLVYLAAAKVGGIWANSQFPTEFLLDNLFIECNVIGSAYEYGVRKLLFLGSSCIYPRLAEQPIKESSLLQGPLEPTNQAYALAKIAGIELVNSLRKQYQVPYISVMPTNLYGPNDNFDPTSGHVLPAVMAKMHKAKVAGETNVVLWGSGKPRREFLFVDDLAEACVFLMDHYDDSTPLNVGVGYDIEIRELAQVIAAAVGYTGSIVWDQSKPDGTPRKLLDISRITSLGWKAKTTLQEGISATYRWFLDNAK